MRGSGVFGGLIVLCCLLAGGAAESQPASGNAHLQEARRLYQNLQYAEAVPELHLALAVAGDDRDQLCEIYALLGTVQVILGNTAEARRAFEQLLILRSSYELDRELSPKIREFFAEVKAGFKPPVQVSFPAEPRIVYQPDGRALLEATLEDVCGSTAWVELWWRASGEEFRRLHLTRTESGSYAAELPFTSATLPAEGLRLDYFLVARGEDGAVLGGHGSTESPCSLELKPPAPPLGPVAGSEGLLETPERRAEWYEQWWVWALVGAALVGAAVGAGVGLSGGDGLPNGTLGEWKLDR